MKERIEWAENNLPKTEDENRLNFLSKEEIEKQNNSIVVFHNIKRRH